MIQMVAETFPNLLGRQDINRDTALVTALTHQRHEALVTLIKSDENFNYLDYDMALMKSIDLGSTASALALISKVKDVNKPYKRNPFLYKAANNGHKEMVEALIERGAEVDKIKASSGTNALMEASRQGHKDVVESLLKEKGLHFISLEKSGNFLCRTLLSANPNLVANWEEDNDRGFTALHFAARFNYTEVIKLLIEFGANTAAETEKKHYTPHDVAIRYNASVSQLFYTI